MIEARYWAIKDEVLSELPLGAKKRELTPDESRAIRRAISDGGTLHSVTGMGAGVLNVSGVLFKTEEDAMWYGGTSFENLNASLSSLQADPAVRMIVLNVDSPGGEVNGTNEFASRIANSPKPVIACVDGMACSAAYWIASQANVILAQETSELGSIGVVATYVDASGYFEKLGVKVHQVVSSQSPMKRPDLSTEEGMAEVRKTIDTLASIFVGKVSTGRGVTEDVVLSEFGRGGVLVGANAIRAKMADGIASLRELLGLAGGRMEITNVVAPVAETASAAAPAPAPAVAVLSDADVKAAYARGVEAERARLKSIDELGSLASFEHMVSEAKYGAAPTSAAELLLAVHTEQKRRADTLRANTLSDASQMPADLRSNDSEISGSGDAIVGGLVEAMKAASKTSIVGG